MLYEGKANIYSWEKIQIYGLEKSFILFVGKSKLSKLEIDCKIRIYVKYSFELKIRGAFNL